MTEATPDLVLTIRVVPGASTNQIVREDETIKVRIQAPPVDGKANKQLIKFLGKSFGVPARNILIEKGENSRNKRIRIVAATRHPDVLT